MPEMFSQTHCDNFFAIEGRADDSLQSFASDVMLVLGSRRPNYNLVEFWVTQKKLVDSPPLRCSIPW